MHILLYQKYILYISLNAAIVVLKTNSTQVFEGRLKRIDWESKLRYEEIMKVKTGDSNLEEKDKEAWLLQEYDSMLSKNKSSWSHLYGIKAKLEKQKQLCNISEK